MRVVYFGIFLIALASCSENSNSGSSEQNSRSPSCPARAGWQFEGPFGHWEQIVIDIDKEGRIFWGGKRISEKTFREYLDSMEGMSPVVYLILRGAPDAPCGVLTQIRSLLNKTENCRILRCVRAEDWFPIF